MKKFITIIYTALLSGITVETYAQDIIAKENFIDRVSLNWIEQATKVTSSLIQDGAIVIQSKDKKVPAMIWVDNLPVDETEGYTIKAKLVIPKVSDKKALFALLFNQTREGEDQYYLFTTKYCYRFQSVQTPTVDIDYEKEFEDEPVINIVHDSRWRPRIVKLPTGKDQLVEVELKRIGSSLKLKLNGAEVLTEKKVEIYSPSLGFWIPGGSSIRVTEVIIEE